LGKFIPGTIDKVIKDDAPEEFYRNRFLVGAMFNLKMVDTIGSGIRRMFAYQAKRYFPMPDYDVTDNRVKATITGKFLDFEFAKALAHNGNLSLEEIVLLDKVQKKRQLHKNELKHLRDKGLIEGKTPNIYISAKIAQATGMSGRLII
jgi:ATP-dependent DNA helicase RecG